MSGSQRSSKERTTYLEWRLRDDPHQEQPWALYIVTGGNDAWHLLNAPAPLEIRGASNEPAPALCVDPAFEGTRCPFTKLPYFMHLEHPELGRVPTYGGPYDSYTIPVPDDDNERTLRSERYDHDEGAWIEGGEPWPMNIVTNEEFVDLHTMREERAAQPPFDDPFQDRVAKWMQATFDAETVANKDERNHRFLEESLELVQSLGCTQAEAHMLVDYVFGRPVGECEQETGGVMVTLAALANASNIRVNRAAETELARCWTKIDVIRAKQAGKPKHSPLPGPSKPPVPEQQTCSYELSDGPFLTGCGHEFWLDAGQDLYDFCPFCGKPVEERHSETKCEGQS